MWSLTVIAGVTFASGSPVLDESGQAIGMAILVYR